MAAKSLKFSRKTALIIVEALMVLAVLGGFAAGAFILRLNQGPLEIGFAKAFIESELSDPANHFALRVGAIYLHWSQAEARPEVSMRNVRLVDTMLGRPVFGFDSADVSLSRAALLLGHIEPRSVIVEKPLLIIVRDADNHIRLALDQFVDAQDKSPDKASRKGLDLFDALDDLSRSPRDLPKSWPLRSLTSLEINDARAMVEDHVLGQSWLVPKIDVKLRRGQSLTGNLSVWLSDERAPEPVLSAQAAYRATDRVLSLGFGLKNLDASFLASKLPDLAWLKDQNMQLNGQAQIDLDSTMAVRMLDLGIQCPAGQVTIPDAYDHPLSFESLALNLAYDGGRKIFTLKDSPVVFNKNFSLSLSGSAEEKEDGGFHVPLKIKVDTLAQKALPGYWPKALRGDPSEEWALDKLSAGRVYDSTVDAVLDIAPKTTQDQPDANQPGWAVKLASLKTDFKIADMTVDYRPPLMPLKGGSGHGVYDLASDRMTIDVSSGTIGDLKLKSGKVTIDVVAGDAIGRASIDADLEGPFKTLLAYIAQDPINVNTIPTDIKKVEGDAALRINVSFPTTKELPAENVDVTAEGTLRNILMPGLVHNLDVTGGPVRVAIKNRRVDVSGKAKLAGHDADFTFAQYFESKGKPFSGQAVANIGIDEDLRKKFDLSLDDWITGTAPGKVTYTDFGGGRAQVDVDADATQATLMVKPMGYTKPAGTQGRIVATATLEKDILTKIDKLSVTTPDTKIDNAQLTFRQSGRETVLSGGSFPGAKLGENSADMSFTISPQNLMTITASGAFVDATPFLASSKSGGDDPYAGPAIKAKIKAAKMRTAKNYVVDKPNVDFSMDKQGLVDLLNFNARAGSGDVVFRYQPDASGKLMTLSITAGDAGAALQAFDVYDNARGGTLDVSGSSDPGGDKHIIVGKGDIRNFRVVKAPVLAQLVNAISLTGILQLLGGEGIDFSRLESRFTWTKKAGGDVIELKDGRTSGASIGLTFDGTVDRAQGVMNISGTIVPVSMVNDIIGGIPLIGNILTGGSKGGVFAATYTIKGSTEKPDTTVNPLSILTPGFLRRIFFEK